MPYTRFSLPAPNLGRLRGLLLCAALLLTPPAVAGAWNLDALMQALAQHPASRASFVESKTLAMLDAPIESSGELRFRAPDTLEMRTLKPRPQTLILEGNRLTADFDGRIHHINLDDHPDAAVLVDSIRATLNGDRAALEREYTVTLVGDRAHWTLTLVPRDARARARVSEIRIAGRRGQVRSIAVEQADGDHSLMTIREQAEP